LKKFLPIKLFNDVDVSNVSNIYYNHFHDHK
jgi:hypothetical protein